MSNVVLIADESVLSRPSGPYRERVSPIALRQAPTSSFDHSSYVDVTALDDFPAASTYTNNRRQVVGVNLWSSHLGV